MGRTDEVQFMLECVQAWRSRGAIVTFEAGWEARGNGLQGNYEGAVVHHTGVGSSAASPFPGQTLLIKGRPDLSGPLCNVAAPWSDEGGPRLHVIAAFPANHAGASGGKSMGPLPVTLLFNPRVVGLEIDYGGNVAMAKGQYKAALIFTRGVCDVLGRSTEYARAHAETSVTGKWDPGYATGKTIDMAAFRRDAASVTGDDMSQAAEQQIAEIHAMLGAGNGTTLPQDQTIGARLTRVEGVLFVGTSGTPKDLTVYQRLARVEDALKALGSGTSSGTKLPTEFDLSSMARAVADELDRRARDGDAATGPVS